MTSLRSHATHRPMCHGPLTPLNLATSERYRKCHGHHTPSSEKVIRSFPIGEREMPLCAKCGVPIAGRVGGYWGDPSSAGKGGRS